MARRGRKHKLVAKRRATTANGQGRIVGMTQEYTLKKTLALGRFPKLDTGTGEWTGIAKPHEDVSSALSIIFERGLLGPEQYEAQSLKDAGFRFAWLYWRNIGSPHPQAANMQTVSATHPNDEPPPLERMSDEEAERLFNRQCDAMQAISRDVYREVCRVCVDDQLPAWVLRTDNPISDDLARRERLIAGLRALAR